MCFICHSIKQIFWFTFFCFLLFISVNCSGQLISFQKISTRDAAPQHSFLQLSPQTQELIRQGAASISYVPVQLDGAVESSEPKLSIPNASFRSIPVDRRLPIPLNQSRSEKPVNHNLIPPTDQLKQLKQPAWDPNYSRLIDRMVGYTAPIVPSILEGGKTPHSSGLHPIPVSLSQRSAQAVLSPLPYVHSHSFPQSSPRSKSSTRDLARLVASSHPTAHSLPSTRPQQTPKRTHLASLDAAAAILAQLDRLKALQAATVSQRRLEGATVPLESINNHFSPNSISSQDKKDFKSTLLQPQWHPMVGTKLPEMAFPVENYCNLDDYPQTNLDLMQLQRLNSHFIYNRSCSPQFFQCSVGQTFVLNCPGNDQAFDPATSSCNFKNSIKLCPEYDHVMHCSIRESCKANQFACCALPQLCIDLQRRCDGHRDCADGEDENNCPSCARNEFACVKNGLCIAAKKRCDGRADDCMDGSNLDEMGCSKNETCWGKFVCDSQATLRVTGHSKCLDWEQHCDGHRDCPGGEDELNCKLMEAKYLLCENQKQSVRKDQWCNGKEECLDGSDEKYCF